VLLDAFAADQLGDSDSVSGAWPGLVAVAEVIRWPRTAGAEVVARCRDAAAVVTNKVVLSKEHLGQLPELRYIGVSATGTNIVDLEAARAAGIAVTNVPGYSTESVAQLVFAFVLALSSAATGHGDAVRAGRWAKSPDFCFFVQPLHELAGKTLVVVGLGAIGSAVARIAAGFGMRVLAGTVPGSPTTPDAETQPSRRGLDDPGRPLRLPLDQALGQADVVSLHCPLTPATAGLANRRFFAALKPGAIFVNTSRGGLVVEADLAAALASGQVASAGLDVLAEEPPPADHPLTDPDAPFADRLIVTPHIAWGTVEARARLREEVAANYAAFLRGERRNRVD